MCRFSRFHLIALRNCSVLVGNVILSELSGCRVSLWSFLQRRAEIFQTSIRRGNAAVLPPSRAETGSSLLTAAISAAHHSRKWRVSSSKSDAAEPAQTLEKESRELFTSGARGSMCRQLRRAGDHPQSSSTWASFVCLLVLHQRVHVDIECLALVFVF